MRDGTLPLRAAVAALAGLLPLAACSGAPELTPETANVIRTEGAAAVRALGGSLQSHLVAAMEEGGPVHAVEFCAGRALTITDSVAEELGPGISLKRVSEKHRNPENAPDAGEVDAIRHFRAALDETGSLPEDWIQVTPAGEYRYYRPLTIAPPCVACHGDPAELDPAVREAIAAKYPEDQATGYQIGDLRGLIRVSLTEARVLEAVGG